MVNQGRRRGLIGGLVAAFLAASVLSSPASAAKPPITIGISMALTSGLAPNGRAALLAMQPWAKHINAKGGLLGRPVKLIYYDDQSNPAVVLGIYTKLLDVDHVNLVVGGYATNMIAPAMPIVMQHHMTFLGLLGLDVNAQFHYPGYFSIAPTGGAYPSRSISAGFFAAAAALKPRQVWLAMTGADAQFSINALDGARALAKQYGSRSFMVARIRRARWTMRRLCRRSRRDTRISYSSRLILRIRSA